MFARISGEVYEMTLTGVAVDVNGLGFEIACTKSTLGQVSIGERISLSTVSFLREDQFNHYGFQSPDEKAVFLALLDVSGVGPKLALSILSQVSMDELTALIEREDVRGLSALPKIGKKTAQQMILTLKGQLNFSATAEENEDKLLITALKDLGFRQSEIDSVVLKAPAQPFETKLRWCLQVLYRGSEKEKDL